jgi:hypothetical protein
VEAALQIDDYDAPLRWQLGLVRRAYALIEAKRIDFIIFVDQGRVYVSDCRVNPWGRKRAVSWERFGELIEAAEQAPARKPASAEGSMEREATA